MTVSRRSRLTRALIVAAMALTFTAGIAEARAGRGGGGFGTRGSRTYQAPPPTNTAPNAAAPINRSAQPAVNPATTGAAAGATGGMFGRGGFMGGLAGGLLGAGLFGMLFGYGMFGGMGGLASILGLLLQIGIVFFIARWAIRYFQSRNQPAAAAAGAGTFRREMPNIPNVGGMGGAGFGARPAPVATRPIEPTKADFDTFESLLGTIQTAYGKGDMATLRANTTAEMAGYFSEELAADETRGLANRIGEVKLLQGDLSEAWREGDAEYATVAMRFSIVDYMVDRDSGKVVEGDQSRPVEATEIWTFRRPRGGVWLLSAIQAA